MDFCGSAIMCIGLWYFVAWVIPAIIESCEKAKAERIKREAEEADARFQREHPEAWRAKEMVKLERERLAAEKELATQRANQESVRNNAGLIAGIGRGLGWW